MFRKTAPVTSASYLFILLLCNITYAEIKIICPSKAITGSPVTISYEGIPENAAVKINKIGFSNEDTFLELFDANGKPVTIFWSLVPGSRTIQLITCDHSDTDPIQITSHVLEYGSNPNPTPIPIPIEAKVAPILSYVKATNVETKDLKLLAEFYNDFSVELLKSNINDTNTFRNAYISAGKKFFQGTQIDNKYSGLSEIVDKVLSDSLSLEIVPLDKVETSKLLEGIAWAFAKGAS